jgi:predicted phage terminase large subunit-like protein
MRELETVGAVRVESVGKREKPTTIYDEDNFSRAHEYSKAIRSAANKMVRQGVDAERMLDLYYKTHLFDAPHFFDSFCIYIEKDRAPEKQFYLPRRKQLLRCVQSIQDLEDGKLHTLGISLAPGVGKTTIAEFGLAWTSGRNPFLPNLIGSHNTAFLTGMYGEMLRIFDPQGEYRWGDVFPGLGVIATNAKDLMIGIGYDKSDDMRFKTLQWGSLGSQLAGRVRAANWMYLDDPVDGIETAMNRERLDKLWQTVYTDFFQRSIGNRTRRLVIGTRWSLVDPIGRLEDFYGDDPAARFIREPVLDENDESRFDYPYGLGYTTDALRKQRDMMDEPSWLAIYQQQPIEREGVLYDASELRRYFSLPDQEPDAVLAICDTKEQGADYCVCPVFYQYGEDFYLDAIICDNSKVEVVQERVAQILVSRKVKMCRIESNRGGTIFAQNVEKRVKEMGGMTSITTRWTQSNKETRIQTNSGMVKSHVLFKDESLYAQDREYRDAMLQLTTYSMMGKNKHDDVPDALAMFGDWMLSSTNNIVTVMKRPF